MQTASFLHHVILSSVVCLAVLYFSILSKNGTIDRIKFLNIKCVLMFSTTFVETFAILRIQRDIIINEHRSSCQVPIVLDRC